MNPHKRLSKTSRKHECTHRWCDKLGSCCSEQHLAQMNKPVAKFPSIFVKHVSEAIRTRAHEYPEARSLCRSTCLFESQAQERGSISTVQVDSLNKRGCICWYQGLGVRSCWISWECALQEGQYHCHGTQSGSWNTSHMQKS